MNCEREPFTTLAQAENAMRAARLENKRGERGQRVAPRAYKCPVCGAYHYSVTTARAEAKKAPKRPSGVRRVR